MAAKAQVEATLEKLQQLFPASFFNLVNESQSGTAAVLRLLREANGVSTAGSISSLLQISTARVAVLLKKMESKHLITKEKDAQDGRITIVRLTELGAETDAELKEEVCAQIAAVIDKLGEERLWEFFQVLEEIQAVVAQSHPPRAELQHRDET